MCRVRLVALYFLIFGQITSQHIRADEDELVVSALKASNDVAWSQMTVRVVDPDGNPLASATVRPWALRAGNGHGGWNEKKYGTPLTTTTDADGKTTVVFPTSNEWSHKDNPPVTEVSLDVRHADYCSKNAHVPVPIGDDPTIPDVALEAGTKLRIAGVKSGSAEPLSECYVTFENQQSVGLEFRREPSGWMQSIPLKENQCWYQVVRMASGELPQFSLPQAWTPDDPASRERLVPVHPGVRVVGTISNEVPRPIHRGYVVVWCGSPARADEEGKRSAVRPVWWMDYAPIAKDGSFEFPSLPAGTLGQFYAYANDSISTQPSDEAYETCCKWFGLEVEKRHPSFRYGQVLRIVRGKPELTIEMELAGQARVQCTDGKGRPLKGIAVSSWPNQYIVSGGSTIFCTLLSSRDLLRDEFRMGMKELWKTTPYFCETGEDGIALVRNLPPGKESIYAEGETWGMKMNEEPSIVSEPGETAQLTIVLERKE